MRITVVLAMPRRQAIVEMDLAPGITAGAAAAASGLAAADSVLGIAGRRVPASRRLEAGDRVEILRPLAADPMDARRLRARRRAR